MRNLFLAIFAVCLFTSIGAGWTRVYGYLGEGMKLVKIETNIGPAYINAAHVVSIRKTNVVSQEGKTEVSLINGIEFYCNDTVEEVVLTIMER